MAKRVEFPQILRKIPATLSWRTVVALLIVSLALSQLVLFAHYLYRDYTDSLLKQAQRKEIEAEIEKWRNVVRERPDYRDAYFELALLTYRLERFGEARFYLRKVFELDPNFEAGRELEKALNKRK